MLPQPQFIIVAPNGARRTIADHPALPIGASALAKTAEQCLVAGAAMIHVHVHDDDAVHVLDPERYSDATRAIQNAVGNELIVQITTEAVGRYTAEDQMQLVRDLCPEAVSIALCEILPVDADPSAVSEFFKFMAFLHANRILPQLILYSSQDVERLISLARFGAFPWGIENTPVLFVLGRYKPAQHAAPSDIAAFSYVSTFENWALCAFGPQEAKCTSAALGLGGSARVGFENNLHLPNGNIAPDNAALVALLAQSAKQQNITLSTADQIRQHWHSIRKMVQPSVTE